MNDIRRATVLCLALAAALAPFSPVRAAAADEDPYALEGAAMREPGNLKLMLKAGRIFTRRFDETRRVEDLNKAEHYLEIATKIDPKSAEAMARYAVARALRAREKNDKGLAKSALKELDTAVTSEPENPLLLSLRGFVEVEVPGDFNRMDQGLADLTKVEEQLKKDPTIKAKYELDVPKIYVKLGKAYRARGKLPEAKRSWEAAVAADPNSKEAATAKKLLNKF
jgi:tetratricopeptide (TPR) repeat protein